MSIATLLVTASPARASRADEAPSAASTSERPAAEKETPVEVTVTGERPAPGASTIDRTESRLVPGSFGDPSRAIDALPGVTPTMSGAPYFYVRGAPPGDVGYLLDGVPIPLIYHALFGPSVINPALLQRVDFYPGPAPARYGRYAGGVVAAETREPEQRLHGEASLRLFDAGGLVEAPFASGRGSVLLGGRYSYTAPLLSIFAPDLHLAYWDYQGRASYDVAAHDRLVVFVFGAHDHLAQDEVRGSHNAATLLDATFNRIELRRDHRLYENTWVREAVTLGKDEVDADELQFKDTQVRARVELTHRPEDRIEVRAGADLVFDVGESSFRGGTAPANLIYEHDIRRDTTVGAYVEGVFFPFPEVELRPGIRADVFCMGASEGHQELAVPGSAPESFQTVNDEGRAELGVDPRVVARFETSERVHIVHALGLAHQPPSYGLPGPQVTSQGLNGGLQTSVQTSSGVEADFPNDVSMSVILFQNAFFNLTEPADMSTRDGLSAYARHDGRSAGVELSLRRRLTRRLGGIVSYTLSRSSREGGAPSSFDRTHVASGVISIDLGRRWRAGVRAVYYSGAPRPAVAALSGGALGGVGAIRSDARPGGSRDARLSAFFRADVRLEKRWYLGASRWMALVAEVQNATLSREEIAFDCVSPLTCKVRTIGPVTLPSVGVEAGF